MSLSRDIDDKSAYGLLSLHSARVSHEVVFFYENDVM